MCPKFQNGLAIQDTSFLDFKTHPKTRRLGHIGKSYGAAHDAYGLLIHSTYALTPNGLPISLLDQEIWPPNDAIKSKISWNNKRYEENSERPKYAFDNISLNRHSNTKEIEYIFWVN